MGTSTITGRVTDKDARPLAGIKVRFSVEGNGLMRSGGAPLRTNGNGEASDVLTVEQGGGNATVTVKATGATSGTVDVTVEEEGTRTLTTTASPTTIDLRSSTMGTSTI